MYRPVLYTLSPGARLVFCLTLLLSLWAGAGWAQVSVLTQHNNNSRTGANLNETVLNTTNVNVSSFGKLFNITVDGFVYAQPLYLPSVNLPNLGIHNVLFVATAHDSVYAFDADTGRQLWKKSLGTPVPSSVIKTQNIQVEVGIIGTPVIDSGTNTLYVVPKTYENSVQIFRLHALDILTGAEKLGGPVRIAAQYPGTGDQNDGAGHVLFVAAKHNQRAALTLVNGVIYVAFASHEDFRPFHGWVLAYNASNLQQLATFNTTPNSGNGGIWMGGQGLVADSSNIIYFMTGNGIPFPGDAALADYSESFVKLGLSGNALSVLDYFKAHNFATMDAPANDFDLGSGGPVAIPGTAYIAGGGKQGLLYLVDTRAMGKLNQTFDAVVQEFQATNGWLSPVFWNNTLYVWGVGDSLKAYTYNFSTGKFNTTVASASSVKTPVGTGGDPLGALSVSSNQSVAGTGIVWATIPLANPDGATVHGELFAFDATNVSKELWDSGQNAPRDDYGNFAKFVPPTVANGKVYVATDSLQVCAYGLNPPTPGWHHSDITVSAQATAFPAAGDPAGYVLGSEFVVYRGTDNHVHQLFATANQGPWSHADLTALTNAPLAVGNPFGYQNGVAQLVVYRGTDNHIHQLYKYTTSTQWGLADLSTFTGAPPAAGDPFGLPHHVDYKGTDGHIHQLYISGSNWVHADLTALTNAPLSAGDPFEYLQGANQIVPFRGGDSHIHQLFTINNNTAWTQADVSALANTPVTANAASDPVGYIFGNQYMDYRGADNHIHQLLLSGTQWALADLTSLAGAPLATGDPFGYVSSSPLVVYKDTNNNIDQLFGSGTHWAFADLSKSAGAPASAGDPSAYTFGNQVVVYRGTDGHIHLLFLR